MENLLFNEIPDSVIDTLFNDFDEHNHSYDKVYHYTSLESFSKIIENGEIWFSNIQSLNDPKEINFGIDVIINYLIDDKNIKSKLTEITRKDRLIINSSIVEDNIFVFSTSTAADTYQQWLNYSNSGNGVCIGIKRKDLFESMQNKMYGKKFIYTYPVQYFDNEINVSHYSIKNFKDAISQCFRQVFRMNVNHSLEEEIYRLLILLASIIKDKFHKDEKEIRYLVFYPFKNIALPHELLKRNQIDILFRNQSFSLVSKLIFHNRNMINMNEKEQISSRSSDYKIIDEIILGPRNSNNTQLFRNIFLFMKKFNSEFNMDQIKFSNGILK